MGWDVSDLRDGMVLVTATSNSPCSSRVRLSRSEPKRASSAGPPGRSRGTTAAEKYSADEPSRSTGAGAATGPPSRPARTCSSRSRESATWACSSRPRLVGSTPWGVRVNRGRPSRRSNDANCWLAAGWDSPRRDAPALTEPLR